MKSYSECIKFDSFIDRYNYLKINGVVGKETFGYNRYLNQIFYSSEEWKRFRNYIIDRDKACDLAVPGFDINSKRIIRIHHINPITLKDIYKRDPKLLDPENVICTSLMTHNAIHYGDEKLLQLTVTERSPNDTCPWKV